MSFLRRTWAEIDTSAIKHNFNQIQNDAAGQKILAVVKADAYGHGAKEIASILQECGVYGFAVSNLDEALILRESGITRPILILGYTPENEAATLAENGITQAVFSLEYAENLSREAEKADCEVCVHIKIDTGMSRLGFDCRNDELIGLVDIKKILELSALKFDGIFTHFAVADVLNYDSDMFTAAQYSRFKKATEQIKKICDIPLIHCCNSAASIKGEITDTNAIRPGIVLYGLSPSDEMAEAAKKLIPAMTLKTVVSMVKTIRKGDTVSYGRSFTAERDMKIATVTAGYADGYPRRLSGKGEVMVNGKRAPIIGRICMDQLMIDASGLDSIKSGDEVILFGKDLSVDEVARKAGTVNYEIVCGITGRVPRIYK